MKNIRKMFQKHFFHLAAAFALVIGTGAVTSATIVFSQQIKCPEELLK